MSAFKLGTVKLKCLLKVVLFPYLSFLNPWVIPSFSYRQSHEPGGPRHFALVPPLNAPDHPREGRAHVSIRTERVGQLVRVSFTG